jgi:ATP-binding cassette subfamily F protein 3
MNLLQVSHATKQFGLKVLFNDAQFSINAGEHVGVIGPNGAGKTTLFKILVGEQNLDEGHVTKSQRLKLGYLEQEAHEPSHLSCEEYLESHCSKALWELKELGADLGLTDLHFSQSFHELSGGYRMRMKLLALIGNEPNLMLLDEPTNFLDLESILALEKFLQGYEGAFLLISHDREVLRRTTDHTLEVEAGDITKFPGNIDDYFEQKAELRQVLEAQAANQETRRKHLQSFIDRFGAKASKAKQAQSRMKQLQKMEKVEIKDLPTRAQIKIPAPVHTGKETLRLMDADLGYTEKKVLSKVNLQLKRGVHLGVVGYNGAGKSTLLKSLGERLPLLTGRLDFGHQVKHSYFAQHVAEELLPKDSVIDSLRKAAHPDITEQEILNIAGSLLFSGDDIHKKVGVLSGGEKSRVALGQILLQKSPLLLMDEPTNHLDFDTVEAMTEALKNYPGTVVIVSHDRGFIGRISSQILEIRNGRAEIYPGSYDEYLWSLEKGSLKERFEQIETSPSPAQGPSKDAVPTATKVDAKKLRSSLAEARKQIAETEKELTAKTKLLEKLNEELLNSSGHRASEVAIELNSLSRQIESLEERLLDAWESLKELEKLR